jgi:hypothetical protein
MLCTLKREKSLKNNKEFSLLIIQQKKMRTAKR